MTNRCDESGCDRDADEFVRLNMGRSVGLLPLCREHYRDAVGNA